MPARAYYQAPVCQFVEDDPLRILGVLAQEHHHALEEQQRSAWLQQISILKRELSGFQSGRVFLEFYIPRMGKRADAVLVLGGTVYVIEFKVGAQQHSRNALDQVEDYALDLKNFHEGSHTVPIVPILVATAAGMTSPPTIKWAEDLVATRLATNAEGLGELIDVASRSIAHREIDIDTWSAKGYRPTPTIVEAAQILYRAHSVAEISRSDSGAKHLRELSASVGKIIDGARQDHTKAICFVTGVPGSGKTLAGLNFATARAQAHREEHAVFLSGNGPLVDVLREALARDTTQHENIPKSAAERQVRSFIQNIHHFRDHYVGTPDVPLEKVVVFDEAQRAWNRKQASSFMQRKRGHPEFNMSEPEFLLGVMDRHSDWCTVVCLVGGGQEINTGEAGISEWMEALQRRFPHWSAHVSPRIVLPEYGSPPEVRAFLDSSMAHLNEELHLAVSMRSFRAETLSEFVTALLDGEPAQAKQALQKMRGKYPIFLTRSLNMARAWLRQKARGTERFGLVASSGAVRLRPEGIHIKADVDAPTWFLNDSTDVRSSFYMEDVASEFAVQGLELDWVGVCWDGDFYYDHKQWTYQSFKGTKWQSVQDSARRLYLKNAYRVLMTRARQGMVIFVPNGNRLDQTRPAQIYDGTFEFLHSCGVPTLDRAPDEETRPAGTTTN